jgi:Uma2 family endonuclease
MMETTIPAAKKVWTEAELQTLPDNGYKYEVVDGELVLSPKNNFEHENAAADLLVAMRTFVKAHRLGAVLGGSLGCWMANRNLRAPDVSFISKARLEKFDFKGSTRKFFPAAPDLAVEVLSPSNTRSEINARLKDFFSSGTQMVWIIDLENQCAEICHSLTERKLIGNGGWLEGEHLLPGFRYNLAELFRQADWE